MDNNMHEYCKRASLTIHQASLALTVLAKSVIILPKTKRIREAIKEAEVAVKILERLDYEVYKSVRILIDYVKSFQASKIKEE